MRVLNLGFLVLVALIAIWRFGGTPAVAVDGRGTLNLSIVDATTGAPVPARIEVVDDHGQSYIADDGIPVGADCKEVEVASKGGDEAKVFNARRITTNHTDKDEFYSTGTSVLQLPPGKHRVTVRKGIEYLSQNLPVTIETGKSAALTVKLARWIKMADRGWYGADGHLHITRSSPDRNAGLSKWMQAEDLQFANLLQWGTAKKFLNSIQYAYGPAGVFKDGDSFIAAGQEHPRTHILGHTMIWGASSAIDLREQYLLYNRFWEEARRQGAITGYAHGGLSAGAQNGLSLDLPQKTIDFNEVLQNGRGKYDVWYNVLNTGFRLTPVAGTDYPCIDTFPGRERFYTQVTGPVTYRAWLDGVRDGRTFVTNGPLLELKVADQGIGGEVRLKKPQPISIHARVFFDATRDDVKDLELVENGRVIKTVARQGNAPEIRLDLKYRAQEAAWLAIRASGAKLGEIRPARALAHSGAVYVTVQNAPSLAEHPRARALARTWSTRLAELEGRLGSQPGHFGMASWSDSMGADDVKKSIVALKERIATANAHYSEQAR